MEINHKMTKVSELEEKLHGIESNERSIISNKSTTKVREKTNQERKKERNVAKLEVEEKDEKDSYKRLEDSIRENMNNCQNARIRLVIATKTHLTIAKRCEEEVNLNQIDDRELDGIKSEISSIERSISDLQPKITNLENQINQQERTKKLLWIILQLVQLDKKQFYYLLNYMKLKVNYQRIIIIIIEVDLVYKN